MHRSAAQRRADLATGFVLALILCRAYVPVGFMPAPTAPFALQICPAGPYGPGNAQHAGAHHGHHGGHADSDSCPFGSSPAAAPVAHIIAFHAAVPVVTLSVLAASPAYPGIGLARAHRARAPPELA